MSDTTLRQMVDADRPMLEQLWQLYSHDLSGFRQKLPDSEGRFRLGRFPTYFGDPDRTGYVLSHDGGLAGFAFVSGLLGPRRAMAEFFVARAARRRRVGYTAARELFARHPGEWEIGFQEENAGAPDFWRRVVTDAVGSTWREELREVPDRPGRQGIPPDHILVFTV